ncbi:hypothetical protein [Anaerorhabdus sp.]|uniref:hypothetical protein n=1 Tax=Anaerorhabdus sp. TaxID=1872524 RepID=UPI002FC778C7
MKLKAKVEFYPNKIQQLVDASDRALELTAEAILSDLIAREVVPKDTGELERSGFVKKVKLGVYQIIFDTPYARRLYWHPEFNFRQDKNANARGEWMEPYKEAGEDKEWMIETYIKFLKQEAGGLIS